MIAGVADTHTALWYLLKNPSLSAVARRFMEEAAEAGNDIVVSPISLAEIVYLVEKNRLPASAYEDLKNALPIRNMRSRKRRSMVRSSRRCGRYPALTYRICRIGS